MAEDSSVMCGAGSHPKLTSAAEARYCRSPERRTKALLHPVGNTATLAADRHACSTLSKETATLESTLVRRNFFHPEGSYWYQPL